MSEKIERLKAKLAAANARFAANTCKILEPGDYRFEIKTASIEHDEKRGYEYWFITMRATASNGEQLTSDRFQMTDDWAWKLGTLFKAVELDPGAFTEESALVKALVGRSGRLTAERRGKWVIYDYHRD
jgi:hypothetical protein